MIVKNNHLILDVSQLVLVCEGAPCQPVGGQQRPVGDQVPEERDGQQQRADQRSPVEAEGVNSPRSILSAHDAHQSFNQLVMMGSDASQRSIFVQLTVTP